jgi:pimeloyl-ACP methyl ester carboxylesterase
MPRRPALSLVLTLSALSAAAGAAHETWSRRRDRALPSAGELVDVGGHQVRRYREADGNGGATVVLIHGAGDCADSWLPVRHRVASFARLVSYDRPGLGGSPAGPPPDVERYLGELHHLVNGSAVEGPVVLVGHSLGGLIAQLYAQRHADAMAGLVLIDPTPAAVAREPGVKAGFAASSLAASVLKASAPLGVLRLLVAAGAMPLYPEQRRFRAIITDQDYRRWIASVVRSFSGAAGAELRSVLPAARYAEQHADDPSQDLGQVPIALITSHAYGETWVQMHRDMAARWSRAAHSVTDDRSHNIHMRHPNLVADTIKRMVSGVT